MKKLGRKFFERGTITVAVDLLGKVMTVKDGGAFLRGRIVEVEAYMGSDDPGSHASRGMTPRNKVMFGKAGFVYVYFIYGNYYCLNFVTEKDGIPGAVLIRGVEPLNGIEVMKKRRNKDNVEDLTNGPGKLCDAFGITKDDNETDLTGAGRIYLSGDGYDNFDMEASFRIGIKEGADLPYRFYIRGNKFVSDYRRRRDR